MIGRWLGNAVVVGGGENDKFLHWRGPCFCFEAEVTERKREG